MNEDEALYGMLSEIAPILQSIDSKMDKVLDPPDNVSNDHFFTYANTGEVATIGTGDTILNFFAGTVKASDGTVSKMSNNLQRLQIESLTSLYIDSSKDVVVQIDTDDKILLKGKDRFLITEQEFTRVSITATASTDVFVVACTNSEALIEMVATNRGADTITEYGVTMTLADTQYSQALPTNTKKFSVQCVDSVETRISFVTGKVAAPTDPYETLYAGQTYYEDNITLSGATLYFACADAGKKMFMRAWT